MQIQRTLFIPAWLFSLPVASTTASRSNWNIVLLVKFSCGGQFFQGYVNRPQEKQKAKIMNAVKGDYKLKIFKKWQDYDSAGKQHSDFVPSDKIKINLIKETRMLIRW